ncbi:hypothetical protein O9992_17720 [Vibrio lentus]|nr:hypothetical protein [Vibrio lentus]
MFRLSPHLISLKPANIKRLYLSHERVEHCRPSGRLGDYGLGHHGLIKQGKQTTTLGAIQTRQMRASLITMNKRFKRATTLMFKAL